MPSQQFEVPDVLTLSCGWDPRELYFVCSLENFPDVIQWSYDYDSPLEAIRNLVKGECTFLVVTVKIPQILITDPQVILSCDRKSYARLANEAKQAGKNIDLLIQEALKVTRISIEVGEF